MPKAKKEAKAKVVKKKAIKKKAAPKEPEFKVKRIRMLESLATFERAYTPGESYEVGKDVSVESAKNYLKKGLAEEDTSLPDPPETK